MDIDWPGSYCDTSNTIPHYMLQLRTNGEFYKCGKCRAIKYQPNCWNEADGMTALAKKHGIRLAHAQMILRDKVRLKEYMSLCHPIITDMEMLQLQRVLKPSVYRRLEAVNEELRKEATMANPPSHNTAPRCNEHVYPLHKQPRYLKKKHMNSK